MIKFYVDKVFQLVYCTFIQTQRGERQTGVWLFLQTLIQAEL